jgi:hypothetical protein
MHTGTASCSFLLAAAAPTTLHKDVQALQADKLHMPMIVLCGDSS